MHDNQISDNNHIRSQIEWTATGTGIKSNEIRFYCKHGTPPYGLRKFFGR